MSVADEIAEVLSAFGGQTVYFPDGGVCGVQVYHRGRWIIARHAPDHPLSPSWVFLDPAPSAHSHYYVHEGESVARMCWLTPWQHRPSHRLIVAVGCGMRFINEEL